MKDKTIKTMAIFICIHPLLDILMYFFNDVSLYSLVRPVLLITIYVMFLISNDFDTNSKRKISIYLLICFAYSALHLILIRNNFYELSHANIYTETMYLVKFIYFVLLIWLTVIIFKDANEKQRELLIKAFIISVGLMVLGYYLSIVTGTSHSTYTNSSIKGGFQGWAFSCHHVGHALIFSIPIFLVIYNKAINKKNKFLMGILIVASVIINVYLIGTKAPAYITVAFFILFTLGLLIKTIVDKKLSKNILFFIVMTAVLLGTFNSTFANDNFKNQFGIGKNEGDVEINFLEANVKNVEDGDFTTAELKKLPFDDRVNRALNIVENSNKNVFDFRLLQIKFNWELYKTTNIIEKSFGYGFTTLPKNSWVESDFFILFFSYGFLGWLLILGIPLIYIFKLIIKGLFDFRKINLLQIFLVFSIGIAFSLVTLVGYTIYFSQTVIYFCILYAITVTELSKLNHKQERDYLFMINDLEVGGAEVGLIDVVNKLAEENKVDLVLLRKKGPLLKNLNSNISVYTILNDKRPKVINKVVKYLYFLGGFSTKFIYAITIKNNYKVECAYSEGFPAVFITNSTNPNSQKITSIRVGIKRHKLSIDKIPHGKFLLKRAYKKIDQIYGVSQEASSEFIEKYPNLVNKVDTIYTYFDVESIKIKAEAECAYKFDRSKTNFMAVGRFAEQKGYNNLITAFNNVCSVEKNALLHIVGKNDTPYGEDIKKMIKDYGLSDKVILHGVQDNPYMFIKNSDYLISSSHYEGFPRVINEALAIGKLCIGTDVTGTREALNYGKRGILVDDSAEGLAIGMLDVIKDKELEEKYRDEINLFDGNKKSFFSKFEELTKKESMCIYMPKLSCGGMEKALINLINVAALNDKYKLTLYLLYSGENNYLELLPKNIELKILYRGNANKIDKIKIGIKLILRYIKMLFNEYDIAISYAHQHMLLTNLTLISSKNTILYIHSNIRETYNKKTKQKCRNCNYKNFTKIICVSENSRIAISEEINRRENVFYINNIIDGKEVISKSKEVIDDFHFKSNKTNIVNISRLIEEPKAVSRIINATYRLNKEFSNFNIILIGDGPDYETYKKMINELNLENVFMLGYKENPYKYLAESDALVLSSTREGYPVVFIESMILNTPIITTDLSDAKQDIDDKYGYVNENSEDGVYLGIKKFLELGFEIKNRFNYLEFNEEIVSKIITVFKEGKNNESDIYK